MSAARLRRGVWVFPSAPAHDIVDAVVAAERLGFDEFWIGDEGPARDPFTLLAAAAVRTSRIALGVAVTNPYLRHPLTTAVEAMTIDELSDGRMRLGIGPGGHVALGPAGVQRVRPLAAVRDAVRTIRAVAAGEAAAGYTPPSYPYRRPGLQVFVGSRSRAFQELASAEADGAFLGGLPRSVLPTVAGWARSTRRIPIALYSTGVAGGPEAVEAMRPGLLMPLADSPAYALDALRLTRDAVAAAAAALAADDAEPARALVSDAVLRELLLSGSPRTIGRELADRARRLAPDSVGMTFTTDDPAAAVDAAAAAFAEMDHALA